MKKRMLDITLIFLSTILVVTAIVLENTLFFIVGLFLLIFAYRTYINWKCKNIDKDSSSLVALKDYEGLLDYYENKKRKSICLPEFNFCLQNIVITHMLLGNHKDVIEQFTNNNKLNKFPALYYIRIVLLLSSTDLETAKLVNEKLQRSKIKNLLKHKENANLLIKMFERKEYNESLFENTNYPLIKNLCQKVKDNEEIKILEYKEVKINSIQKQKSKLTVLFNLLAIFSIFFALFTLTQISNNDKYVLLEASYYDLKKMWVFFLFIPLPLLSIIHGVYKCKNYKTKSNIIVGLIFALLLTIYGSFTFIFQNNYSTDTKHINYLEKKLSIDLPESSTIIIRDWTSGNQSSQDSNYLSRVSIIRINDENFVFNHNYAKTTLTEQDKKFVPSIFSVETINYENFIIYNVDENKYNDLDYTSGLNYICLAYDKEQNLINCYEFYKK